MSCHKHAGSASRSAALDLLLKTFTNPTDIFTQNSLKHQFETISRIVPGTTPRQCTRRWEELRSVVCKCDCSKISSATGLEATVEGKPPAQSPGQLNSQANSRSHQRLIPSNEAQSSSTRNDDIAGERSSSRLSGRLQANRGQVGGCVAVTPQSSETELGQTVCSPDANTSISNSVQAIIIIHVIDEAKKMKQDFACPRDILVREMRYFAQYLLPGNKDVEDMDISVHCDIAVFDWLMRYTKRGMREGPMGETLPQPQEAPKLDVTHVASILISSDFLQMETLVEECLNFFHKHVSQILSLNASNISSNLIARLAAKFTPTEVEQIVDKRDRFKRKMYAYLLQQFFDKDYCRVDCPANGSTLFRCTHCCQLLTVDQQQVFPCTSQRMVVCRDGSVGYRHHRDPSWSPARAIQELQQGGYSLRDIFWWFWGTVNWLVCEQCKQPFKCNSLKSCAFYTIPASSPPQPHPCCGKESSTLSLFPNSKDGCTFHEHVVMDSSLDDGHLRDSPVLALRAAQAHAVAGAVYSTLQAYKDTVCLIESGRTIEQLCTPDSQWLQKECVAPLDNLKVSRSGLSSSSSSSYDIPSRSPSVAPYSSSQQAGRSYPGEQPMCSYDGGTEEEDGYAPKAGIVPKVTSNKNRQVKPRDDSSHPVVIQHRPLDWTWDSSKSRRWNQDLQREWEEQKLDLLISRMQNTKTASPKKPCKNKETCFTGGTYCHLEARFRAQQSNKMTSAAVVANSQSMDGEAVELRAYEDETKDEPLTPDAVVVKTVAGQTKWQDAARLVKEGLEAVYDYNPSGKWSLLCHKVLHHWTYTSAHLLITITLLLLALIEHPGLYWDKYDPYYLNTVLPIHCMVEMFLLALLAGDAALRLVWIGPRKYVRSWRSLASSIFILIMFLDALVTLARLEPHIRILRVLRPFLWLETFLMNSTRRVLRQIIQCFKPIFDVLLLLFYLMAFCALSAFYLFGVVDKDFFSSYGQSFVSLFILRTTANYPDVMMEMYHYSPASFFFFLVYLIIALYIMSNVLLGVVYSNFKTMELKKFKKIYMNKREKLKAAFTLLSEGTEGISFEHFLVFMKEYKPETPSWQVLCMYKALLSDKTDLIFSYFDPTDVSVLTPLSLDRFYGFYQVAKLKWIKDIGPRPAYFEKLPSGLRSIFKFIHKVVTWRWFNTVISAIILANLVYSLVFAGLATVENRYELAKQGQPGSLIFTFIYCVEIALRIIGMGPLYFRSGWNWFDLVIISISTISQILEFVPALGAFIVLRSLRLFRMFRLKSRFRAILTAVFALSPQLIGVALVMVAMMYIMSIIGMETMYGLVSPYCCNTSWYFVGAYYAGGYNSTTNTVFWLNNFDNLARSYVTLFEQVVVNNWFVMMEGFASQVESQYAYLVRVYFIVFPSPSFDYNNDRRKFKLFCKKQHGPKCGCFMMRDAHKKRVRANLSYEDLNCLKTELEVNHRELKEIAKRSLFKRKLTITVSDLLPSSEEGTTTFFGTNYRARDDLYLMMYEPEIVNWHNALPKEGRHRLRSFHGNLCSRRS
ncbi:hypothetical protein EMCRGX_G024435 [Ephydatia muelleri]